MGFFVYYLTSFVCFAGPILLEGWVPLCTLHPDATGAPIETFAGRFAAWDGVWYRRIIQQGYSYQPDSMSSVAFFPLYPLSCRLLMKLTGLHVEYVMLLTSHLYLVGAFVMFAVYLQEREKAMSAAARLQSLLCFGLIPSTFYWRMCYSESAFLFVSILAMYGMQKQWRSVLIAGIIGLATSCRVVGISLLVPFAWHLWKIDRSTFRFIIRGLGAVPLCCWGLVSYMAFQWIEFGTPLAFQQTQQSWLELTNPIPFSQQVLDYLTLRPLWQVYDPSCRCYWAYDPPSIWWQSMQFFNPLMVIMTWVTVGWGACRKTITAREILLCLGLLAIPYFTHTYRCCAASESRYMSVVFPIYLVLGQWMSHLPVLLRWIVYVCFAGILGACATMFVQWYWFF